MDQEETRPLDEKDMGTLQGGLVSTDWLERNLRAPNLRIIDASWYLPIQSRNPQAEYEARHIPGAVFFDLDAVSDQESPLPHMLPSEASFADAMGALGISNDDGVVVYDGLGLWSAPRLWWMLRVMGHDWVAVLDGGMPHWMRERRALESGAADPRPARFHAKCDTSRVAGKDRVLSALGSDMQILDARAPERFRGEASEPRPGVRPGHIPGALSLPFSDFTGPDGLMLQGRALENLFLGAGASPRGPVIASCGSGVTAAVILLGLHRLGAEPGLLYDGSWTEWGGDPALPLER